MPRPTDEDYDNMHHALGRPKTVDQETHRNYFCVSISGVTAARFAELGWWTLGRTINGGADGIYMVNAKGREALGKWLKTPAGKETVRKMSR